MAIPSSAIFVSCDHIATLNSARLQQLCGETLYQVFLNSLTDPRLAWMSLLDRRHFCKLTAASLALAGCARPAFADLPMIFVEPDALDPRLFAKARAAFNHHHGRLAQRDVIAVADFSAPSRLPRFHIVNMISGESQALLVSHGKGSDPDHSGFVRHFSNAPGSEATSSGSYLLSERYYGQHGASRRLIGLDPQNNMAEDRAIVIHAAWYVSEDIAAEQGKIGRSQGCFAFSQSDIGQVLEQLGPGTLLYADKIA